MSRTRKPTTVQAPQTQDLNATIIKGLHPLVVEIGTLTPDAENARSHDERNIESIAASLRRYRQRKPIVVQADGNRVRAGNGTLQAAKRLGWTHIAAVVVEENDVEAAAYAIADNRTAELAEWDFEMFHQLIDKYHLDTTEHALGFSVEEISNIMTAKAWDEGDLQDVTGAAPSEGGEDELEGKNVASTIKVKVIDVPYRARVQKAIQELLEADFKGLAKVV
jgi:ParB-like chromosome segregation protein Spo0J